EEHRHHRHTLPTQAAQQRQVVVVAGTVGQVGQIALELGVGVLAEHHDGDVGLVPVAAIDRQFGVAAGCLHLPAYACPDRGGAGEVGVGQARALPGQRPAAV